MTRGVRAAAGCLVWLGLVASAGAQTPADFPARRFEAAAGGLWLAGADLGSTDAELRSNEIPPDGFRLFSAESRAAAAPGFDARFGYWLTRTVAVEGGFVFSRPALRTRITSDAEGAPALDVEERLDQYFVDASVVLLLEGLRLGDGTVPFVSGGAGYLRQLHEGRTLVETGQVYHGGAGIRHLLRMRPAGFVRAMGLRIDGRVYILTDGAHFEDRPRPHGAISGALFVTF